MFALQIIEITIHYFPILIAHYYLNNAPNSFIIVPIIEKEAWMYLWIKCRLEKAMAQKIWNV